MGKLRAGCVRSRDCETGRVGVDRTSLSQRCSLADVSNAYTHIHKTVRHACLAPSNVEH